MIDIVTGKTGHGKTSWCVTECKRALENGVRVYSNTTLNPRNMFSKKKYLKLFGDIEIWGDISKKEDRENPNIKILYWQNFDDWQYFENGLIFCDEGLVYFNARNWENLPEEMRMKLVQQRKDRLDMLVNVQHFTFIDKTLRMLAESFIHVELKWGSPKLDKSIIPRVASLTAIDLPTLQKCENMGIDPYNATKEEMEKMRIKIESRKFWIKKKIFSWYDTSKKMVPSRPVSLVHLERSCNNCDYVKVSHA